MTVAMRQLSSLREAKLRPHKAGVPYEGTRGDGLPREFALVSGKHQSSQPVALVEKRFATPNAESGDFLLAAWWSPGACPTSLDVGPLHNPKPGWAQIFLIPEIPVVAWRSASVRWGKPLLEKQPFLTVSEDDLPSLSISFGSGGENHCVFLSNGERNVRTERCYASVGREVKGCRAPP